MKGFLFILLLLLVAISSSTREGTARIVGGGDAKDGEAPYMVSFGYPKKHLCGGVILNKRYILTAAHCVENLKSPLEKYTIITGTNQWVVPGAKYYIEKVFIHCNYDNSVLQNDLALLRLNKSIAWNNRTQPIKLAYNKALKAGYPVVLTGWGVISPRLYPALLQKVEQFVVPNDECGEKWYSDIKMYNGYICAYNEQKAGGCKADSGSPLIDEDHELIGIANAAANDDCASVYSNLYASTLYHRDWISIIMSENDDCISCNNS